MKKIYKTLVFFLMTALIFTACSKSGDDPVPYEGGALHQSPSGSFYIAELHGTFHQMGRQYGLMMKDQLASFYKEAVEDFLIGEQGRTYDQLLAAGEEWYRQFPQMFKDFTDGCAQTDGLGTEKTRLMSYIMIDIYETGCSSLSAWGDYTTDGKTVVGRNLDLGVLNLTRFGKYFNIVVFNPTGYPASVANLDFIGSIFYQTAMNSSGIFLELQNGQAADTSSVAGRENTNDILLESLFSNTSSEEYDQWFNTTYPDCGLIMNASYPTHATIYEWATYRMVPRNTNGLISASNDFIDPSWHNYPIIFWDSTNEFAYTWTRRTHLLQQGELYKGEINPQKMMEIFDKTIQNGGATFPDEGNLRTVYSVVAQPSANKIWLKYRTYSGWEEIDLNKYFDR